MVSTRSARTYSSPIKTPSKSVLGKRAARDDSEDDTSSMDCTDICITVDTKTHGPPTPDPSPPNPKRTRTLTTLDDTSNKENIPPIRVDPLNDQDLEGLSTRARRLLTRRASADAVGFSLTRSPSPFSTPTRIRRSPTAPSLVAPTPSTSLAQLSLQTPPITPAKPSTSSTAPSRPLSLLPLETRARALLRATCNAGTYDIAGRASERATILSFINAFLRPTFTSSPASKRACGTTALFISGSPGTGKTALMNHILAELSPCPQSDMDTDTDMDADADDVQGVQIVNVNCLSLGRLEAVWERIAAELSAQSPRTFNEPQTPSKRARSRPQSPTKQKKRGARDEVVSLIRGMEGKCILVLDELDHLATSSTSTSCSSSVSSSSQPSSTSSDTASTPLGSLFALAQAMPTRLRIIGIANTHTLLSNVLEDTVTTVHFKPYEPNQLLGILRARLAPLSVPICSGSDSKAACDGVDVDGAEASSKEAKELEAMVARFLPPTTLTLLSKKVGALTGDVRALFEVLRGAIDLAARESKKTASDSDVMASKPLVVSPAHVLAALRTYSPSGSTTTSGTARSSTAAPPPTASTSSGLPTPPKTSPLPMRKTSASETATKVASLSLHARLVLSSLLLGARRLGCGLSLNGSGPTIGAQVIMPSGSGSPSKLKGRPLNMNSTPSKEKISPSTPSTDLLPLLSSHAAAPSSIESTALHTFYTALLTASSTSDSTAAQCFITPVSRPDFGDLLGLLETAGLVRLSSSSSSDGAGSVPSTPRKGAFKRTGSFGGGKLALGSAGAGREVSLVPSVRVDEVLRGLGVSGASLASSGSASALEDPLEAEVRLLWAREVRKIGREVRRRAEELGRARELEGWVVFEGCAMD